MVDRIRYPTVSYLPFYYVFFQFLLLTIFNLQANILTTKDILSNLGTLQFWNCLTKQKQVRGTGGGAQVPLQKSAEKEYNAAYLR